MDSKIRKILGIAPSLTSLIYLILIISVNSDNTFSKFLIGISLLSFSFGFTFVMFSKHHLQKSTFKEASQAAAILGIKILVIIWILILAAFFIIFSDAHA